MSLPVDESKFLIIANWFRTLIQSEISIEDISKIIVAFARFYEVFDDYDGEVVAITDNGTIATVLMREVSAGFSIYCKQTIPNETKQVFTWKVKCCRMKMDAYWGVGFDAVHNEPQYRDYFYNDYGANNYIFEAGGDIWRCGERVDDHKTSGWTEGDIVSLIYDGANRELSISINDKPDENSKLRVEESEGGFRAVLFMSCYHDKAELLQ